YKLSNQSLVKAFILSTLFRWESLGDIELGIRSKKEICHELQVNSISASQLSRRLQELDTENLAELLGLIARQYWALKSGTKGIHPNVGLLRLIDSSFIKLPNYASDWTAVSKDSSGVKIHLRLAIASANSTFPEKMVPSSSNVSDIDVVNYLVDADDATYVMDRGYGARTKIGGWLERNVKFLVRVRKNFKVETIKEHASHDPHVTGSADVFLKTR